MAAASRCLIALLSACLLLGPTSGRKLVDDNSDWERKLPVRACHFSQASLISKDVPVVDDDCQFVVRSKAFLDILGKDSKIEIVAEAAAHEAGVWDPDHNSFWFSSVRQENPPNAWLGKVSLSTGEVTVVFNTTHMANGGVLDNEGNLIMCMQGNMDKPGHLLRIDPDTLHTKVVVDNWFGLQFNSPNDAVVSSDGAIWFTDPAYGVEQKFKGKPQVGNYIYRVSPSGFVDVAADGFVKPNGLALSADETILYVTDTGYISGDGSTDPMRPHHIVAFDVTPHHKLVNRRFFAEVANYLGPPSAAVPDGIKVDTAGRVYVACLDGIHVYCPHGTPLGLIRNPGTANFGFAGRHLNKLVMLNDTTIQMVTLSRDVEGAGLYYAKKVEPPMRSFGALVEYFIPRFPLGV